MTLDAIIECFCQEHQTTKNELFSNTKQVDISYVRYMIWFYLHYNMGLSANQLAKIFNRNRPSIFRGMRIIKHNIKHNREIRDKYHSIVERLEQ